MKTVSRRNFIALSGAAAASVAVAGLTGCSNNEKPAGDPNALTVDANLAEMTWEQILEEAKGQTVTFLAWGSGGADAFVQKYWDQLKTYVADQYDIKLQLVEYAQAEYEKIGTDIENGGKPTYDLFWFTGAMFAPFRAADGLFGENWMTKLDSYKYLNPADPFVAFDGLNNTDNIESPFQGCQQMLVYSQDKWSRDLAWDASEGEVKGLFHNFAELAQWVQKNPGKFSYMDLTGAGNFHGILLLKALLSELTDDGNGGWKTVYDEADDAAARRQKIQANIDAWWDWSNSADCTEEAFYEKAGYVWAYLNDIKPYLLQGDNGPLYIATAPEMMQYVIAGDLACTFTTCTSIASRVEATPDAYMANPGILMMQTSIGYWDYNVIFKNSPSKAAAMVVSNAMLEPAQQLLAFETTGNGYNVDVTKLDAEMQDEFAALIEEMGALSPSAEEVATNGYVDKFGKIANWIASGWDQKVNRA